MDGIDAKLGSNRPQHRIDDDGGKHIEKTSHDQQVRSKIRKTAKPNND